MNVEASPSVDLAQQLRKIIKDNNITQAAMAEYADISESQFSRVLSGAVQLSLRQLAMIASNLNMREIDIYTYPDVYVKKSEAGSSSKKISVTFEVDESEKEYLLRLVNKNH